jgi:hypothetical protein
MRAFTQYLVAGSIAATLVGGLALASTKLTPAPQPVIYCASMFGQPQFLTLCHDAQVRDRDLDTRLFEGGE